MCLQRHAFVYVVSPHVAIALQMGVRSALYVRLSRSNAFGTHALHFGLYTYSTYMCIQGLRLTQAAGTNRVRAVGSMHTYSIPLVLKIT